jgi:predicted DNA-binding transcriptional regulator AlpA
MVSTPNEPALALYIDYDRLADAIAARITVAAPATRSKELEALYWTVEDIMKALNIKSRKTAYDVVKKKGFPEPRYITSKRHWNAAKVLTWAESRHVED